MNLSDNIYLVLYILMVERDILTSELQVNDIALKEIVKLEIK